MRLHEMLAFILEKDAGLTKGRARSTASYFADMESFLNSSRRELEEIRGIGRRRTIRLRDEEIDNIIEVKRLGYIDPQQSVSDNFLSAMGREFSNRQLKMINEINLDKLSVNPFLIKTLNLSTPEELIRLNVYMLATRSIVTSMGFFVEKLLLSSSSLVEKAPRGTGWDIIKEDIDGETHWIQVKSGPSPMDKDQIVYWTQKIQEKISEGDKAYIGITYGKRTNNTITFNLMKQLLPDWEIKTLIGKELWNFLGDDPEYLKSLFNTLRRSAQVILGEHSIFDEIESCIERVTIEFLDKYGEGEEGISKYIDNIF